MILKPKILLLFVVLLRSYIVCAQENFSFLGEIKFQKTVQSTANSGFGEYVLKIEDDSNLVLYLYEPFSSSSKFVKVFNGFRNGAIAIDSAQNKLFLLLSNNKEIKVFSAVEGDTSFIEKYSRDFDPIFRFTKIDIDQDGNIWAIGTTDSNGFVVKIDVDKSKYWHYFTPTNSIINYRSFQFFGNKVFMNKRGTIDNDRNLVRGIYLDVFNDTLGLIKTIDLMDDSLRKLPHINFQSSNDFFIKDGSLFIQTIMKNWDGIDDRYYLTTACFDVSGNSKYRIFEELELNTNFIYFPRSIFVKNNYLYSIFMKFDLNTGKEFFYLNQYNLLNQGSLSIKLFENLNSSSLHISKIELNGDYFGILGSYVNFLESDFMMIYKLNYPLNLFNPDDISGLKLYPNPTSNSITLDFGQNSCDSYNIAIYDNSGKLRISQIIHYNKATLSTHLLEPGLYFLNISNDETFKTMKFTIVK